jgi:hypothetical protein
MTSTEGEKKNNNSKSKTSQYQQIQQANKNPIKPSKHNQNPTKSSSVSTQSNPQKRPCLLLKENPKTTLKSKPAATKQSKFKNPFKCIHKYMYKLIKRVKKLDTERDYC